MSAVASGRKPGTAAAALSHREFRIVWLGFLGSNLGTWMHNAALAAYAYDLTGSKTYLGVLYFSQLGAQFFLSMPAGAYVDNADRKRVLLVTQWAQLVVAAAMAVVVWEMDGTAREVALPVLVGLLGVAGTYFMPAWQTLIAQLVGPEDLPGAVSLGFVQLNLSRVIGPLVGVILYKVSDAGVVFLINAATYLISIGAVWVTRVERPPARATTSISQRIREAFALVGRDRTLRWCMLSIFVLSALVLPSFLSQMPALASDRFGFELKSYPYAMLQATFGLGAAIGAISVGTVLSGRPLPPLSRVGFVGMAVCTGLLALSTVRWQAYVIMGVLGVTYFVAVTALATAMQQRLDNEIRGRVISLWAMAFGGTVPLGALLAGVVADWFGLPAMMAVAAVAVAGLALAVPRHEWFAAG